MKIVVTGSNGFLGIHTTKQLVNLGHSVIALSRSKMQVSHPLLTNIIIDLNDLDTLNMAKDIDAIFHIAANINFDNSPESIAALTADNIIATNHVADFVIRHHISKVVFASSCSVYDHNYDNNTWVTETATVRPQNLYAVSKLTAEWLLHNKLKNAIKELVVLRYSSIYGYGQSPASILPMFINRALKGNDLMIFGSGNRVQDYVYVDDAVQANIACLTHELPFYTILNIGSGQPVTDFALAGIIAKVWNSTAQINILNQNSDRETILNYSISKAAKLIGYSPVSMEIGLNLYKLLQAENS